MWLIGIIEGQVVDNVADGHYNKGEFFHPGKFMAEESFTPVG